MSGPSEITLDSSTRIGAWMPGAADAGTTSATVGGPQSAGTSLLSFTFPAYFTTAPTNVAVAFNSSVPNTVSNPVVTWASLSNSAGVADYKVTVTNSITNVATVYDTQSTATSYALPAVGSNQNFVTVTAFDANAPAEPDEQCRLVVLGRPARPWLD